MLFDLRGRGRRRTVQAVYASLALLMGGSLVLLGIGGATSGGLLDAFKSGGGGASPNDAFAKRITAAEKATQARPRDPAPWAALARAHAQAAGTKTDVNGAPTKDSLAEYREATGAWERYAKLKSTGLDPTLAPQIVRAYVAQAQWAKAVGVQEIVIADQGASTGQYSTYAQLAYAAGQTRKGDLAAAKAVSLAPADQRPQVKAALAQVKQNPTGASQPAAPTG